MGNVENEGEVYFKASKKPERPIFRIFNIFTNKGDLVLDSFLGSGTTAAATLISGRKRALKHTAEVQEIMLCLLEVV